MSRAYRISVRESASHVIRASDHVSTQLELLEILPPERMADILANELLKRGFEKTGETLTRKDGAVTVEVDPKTATITVRIESQHQVELEGEKHGWADRDAGNPSNKKATEALRQELLKDLQRQADQRSAELQKKLTDELEGHLADIRKELDQVVNRVTADALKEKAASLGQIKEMTEDPQSGSLTIILEV